MLSGTFDESNRYTESPDTIIKYRLSATNIEYRKSKIENLPSMSTIRQKIQNTSAYLRRLLTQPSSELNRWQLTARYVIELTRHCARALRHDKAAQMAAALTYHTLFSLMPTLVLVLVSLASFKGLEQYHDNFKGMVVGTLLPETLIQGDEPDPEAPQAIAPRPEAGPFRMSYRWAMEKAAEIRAEERVRERAETDRAEVIDAQITEARKRREFAQARVSMEERIQGTLDQLGSVSFGSIGIVGLLVFIYGATALLSTIERSFSMIFGVGELRPIRLRLPIHFTVITLGPLVLIAGQLAQQQFIDLIRADSLTNWLAGPMVVLSPLLTSWLVLFAIFSLMPNAFVQRRAAAIGSFVAAVLWLVGKEAFGYYVLNANTLTSLYGALALVPLFLFWIYITWLVVLFGLELTYTIQNMKGRKFKHVSEKTPEQVLLDATWLIPVAAHVAADFAEGKQTQADKAATALQLPPHTVRKLLRALVDAQLVHRLGEGDNETATYTLARPADRIAVADVLDAASSLMPAAPDGEDAATPDAPAWQLAHQLQTQHHDRATGQTLAQLTVHPDD